MLQGLAAMAPTDPSSLRRLSCPGLSRKATVMLHVAGGPAVLPEMPLSKTGSLSSHAQRCLPEPQPTPGSLNQVFFLASATFRTESPSACLFLCNVTIFQSGRIRPSTPSPFPEGALLSGSQDMPFKGKLSSVIPEGTSLTTQKGKHHI